MGGYCLLQRAVPKGLTTSNKVIFGQRSKRICETDDADIRAGGEEGPFHAEETTNVKVLRQNGTHCV